MNKVDLNKISEYVILFCQNLGVTISPLKLQKLLYYIQSWHIAKLDKELLFDSLPEAWVNGPVYRKVYNSYKDSFFRNQNIQTDLDEIELSKKLGETQNELNISENQLKLVNAVLSAYSKLSDERLVLMTHSEKPWNEARKGLSPIERSDKELSIETIYSYFTNKSK
jgi:uncharacterized phage-associated protein